jgi:hypothetical protein
MVKALPPEKRKAVLAALQMRRVAQWVARDFEIATSTVTRLAQRHGVALVSQSEHLKSRRNTPEFIARQAPAQHKAASAWLKANHEQVISARKLASAARFDFDTRQTGPGFSPRVAGSREETSVAPGQSRVAADGKGETGGSSCADRGGFDLSHPK